MIPSIGDIFVVNERTVFYRTPSWVSTHEYLDKGTVVVFLGIRERPNTRRTRWLEFLHDYRKVLLCVMVDDMERIGEEGSEIIRIDDFEEK
jgi:hypothetical protein